MYTGGPDTEDGSIPAHAGEPLPKCQLPAQDSVYPRPCGGTCQRRTNGITVEGLSPPMRGNRGKKENDEHTNRSIPAHAGEPKSRTPKACHDSVYPRPCGGTGGFARIDKRLIGLSPPMRGNPRAARRRPRRCRSIPAHAGEPARRPIPQVPEPVYPRPCGGTTTTATRERALSGLSPPMRGNRQ